MEDITSLNAKVALLTANIAAEREQVQGILTGMRAEVSAMKTQVASGSPLTQADMDAFGASLDVAIGAVTMISEAAISATPVVAVDPAVVVDPPLV